MTSRSDIIDGSTAKTSRSGLIYTCKAGWIDLGHARPDGALGLWQKILRETGPKSKNKKGYKLTYAQTFTRLGWTDGATREYFVKIGLTPAEKESVALAVFMEVSMAFESVQGGPLYFFSTSSFSMEDLVSDLLGFYRAVRSGFDFVTFLEPVSKDAALKIWDTYGGVGNIKNKTFNPFLFPCAECKNNPNGPVCGTLPAQLQIIKAASKGPNFHDWTAAD